MTTNLLDVPRESGHARRRTFRRGMIACIVTGLLACGLVPGGTRAGAAPPPQRVDFRSLANQRRPGGPSAKVQDLLGGDDLQGHDIPLTADITLYSLDALPREEPMGQVKAGVTVHAGEEVAPALVRVKFATSSGHEYEGATRFSDLVPQHTLKVEFAVDTSASSNPSASHRNVVYFRGIPPGFFSTSDRRSLMKALKFRFVRQDGTVEETECSSVLLVSPHPPVIMETEYRAIARLAFAGARPGDEYLGYLICNADGETWVTQPFGLQCGEGERHMDCVECYSLLPQEKAEAMLERAVTARKAKAKAARRPDKDAGRLVILAHPTPIYSPAALPQEKVMGTLPAGTKVLALGETGGGFVRVKFVTPGGRGLEGAAKASDLGEEPENGF